MTFRPFCCYFIILSICLRLGENIDFDVCSHCACSPSSENFIVNCSHRTEGKIPRNIPFNVTILDLSLNSLKRLPRDTFVNLHELTELNLSSNVIEELHETIFEQNAMLQKINLSNNSLKRFARDTFVNLHNLTELDLSINVIEDLQETIFEQNVMLREINLGANKITVVPEQIFAKNINLHTIALGDNKIREVPEKIFAKNIHLQNIDLYKNSLKRLPRDVFVNLHELRQLNLPLNFIQELQETIFEQNVMLKKINLGVNKMVEVPAKIFSKNLNLKTILINRNLLKYIPEDIFANNVNMRHIDLSCNKLQKLPSQLLRNNTNLKTLRIGSNGFTELPEMFFNSSANLSSLDISNNTLTKFNKSNFQGLNKIDKLIMYNNGLSTLSSDLFSGVSLDGVAFLSYNGIREIPRNLFCSKICSHQLKWLFLHKNELTYLHNNAFKGLHHMTHLFLHGNDIQALGNEVFEGTSIQYIFLFSNKLIELTNSSFSAVNDSLREIHIYKNDIQFISNKSLPDTKKKVKIFVDCDKLEKLPKIPGKTSIACVQNTMLPDITINYKEYITAIQGALRRDAFNCTSAPNIPICRPCPAGTLGNSRTACLPCPAGGFYQDEIGRRHCKRCRNGTFVRNSTSTSAEDCEVCPEGTDSTSFAGHRACFCKMNYARTDRFKGCVVCFEEGLNCTDDYKWLLPGYYWNWNFTGANISEYSKFVYFLRYDGAEYKDSNSRYSQRIPKVYQCPRKDSCVNRDGFESENIHGNCEKGYKGWLCDKCENTYYSMLNACVPCPGKVWIVLDVIIILCLACCLYCLISRQIKIDEKQVGEKRSLIDKLSSQMKIVLGFYQVVGELFESFGDVFIVKPLKLLGKLMSYLKSTVLRVIIRPHCYSEKLRINIRGQLIICLSFPPILASILTLCYVLWKVCLNLRYKKRHEKEKETLMLRKAKDRLLTYAVFLLFITYTPTCDIIFKLYPGACKTFQIYDDEPSVNITLLRADFDIECEDLRAYQSLAYIATVCYVLAFPFTLYVLLQKYCKKNCTGQAEDPRFDNQELQYYSLGKDQNTPLLHSKRTYARVPVWLKFLCENYKPEYWYWEIVELARKVSQTVLVTLLGWEDILTKLFTISISVLFLTLHAKLSPMAYNFEQRLQMFSLAAIFVNVLLAAVPIDVAYQEPLSIALIVLNMIIVITVTAEVIVAIFRFIMRRRQHSRGTS